MKNKVISMLLAITMCVLLCTPALAASATEPATPDGYTYWYTTTGNADVNAALSSVGLTLILAGPIGNLVSIVISGVSEFESREITGTYTDKVYKCDDPKDVPYIYFHKIKYTAYFDADGDGKRKRIPAGHLIMNMPRCLAE